MKSPVHEQITSRKNPRIQRVHKLLDSRQFRESEKVTILEGVRLIEEAVRAGWAIDEFFFTDTISERGKALLNTPAVFGGACFRVSEEVLQEITETESPQGIVAVLPIKEISIPGEVSLALILDAIRDPGNVGTIMRTALAAGVDLVIIAPQTADPYSSKVMRSAMGAQMWLPVRIMDWQAIASSITAEHAMNVLLADTQGGRDLWETDLKKPTALIVSNEANGPSSFARNIATDIIRIPMVDQSESLNAAIAASLLVYEAMRQRRAG